MSIFRSIVNDVQSGYSTGNMVRKILLTNFIVFIVIQLLHLSCNLIYGAEMGFMKLWSLLYYFCFSSYTWEMILRPWTWVTATFAHQDIWHLIGNLIWLYLFGNIVGDLIGDRRVLPIYLMGGLAGGLLFFISSKVAPNFVGDYALGASGAVMAFGGAALILNPDYRVGLLLFGEVKLKYIVLVMVLLDLVGTSSIYNAGGHAGHLGGFIFGVIYVYQLRDGRDWAVPVNRFLDWLSGLFSGSRRADRQRAKMRASHSRPTPPSAPAGPSAADKQHEDRLNAILDKIKQQGYEHLSQEEKDFLYNASKR
jgi:membrane associated rhomboid family serine protease